MNKPQATKKKLTRSEGKAATRQRLLDAGYLLIMEEGITALSMNKVTKQAGIAQPSFYTHFSNLAELIDEIAQRLKREFLFPAQQALIATFNMPNREDKSVVLRRMYRFLVEGLFANGFLMQQALERHQTNSVFGQHIQSFYIDLKSEWLAFLSNNADSEFTQEEQERYSMAIDCIFAMMETLVMGLTRGEYKDKDAIIDIMTVFTINQFGELIDNNLSTQ